MIGCSFTTLWEHYDRWWASWLNAFDEGSSLNHGWNPPAIVLGQDIAGVRPVEDGRFVKKEAQADGLNVSLIYAVKVALNTESHLDADGAHVTHSHVTLEDQVAAERGDFDPQPPENY